MFNVQLPSNSLKFIGAMIPVALWDLFDGFDEDFVLANWPEASETEQPYSDQIADIGFEDRNYANNMGTVFYVMLSYFFKVGLLLILISIRWCCGARCQCCDEIIKKLKNAALFNDLIAITVETYVEIIFTGFLTVSQPKFEMWGDYMLFGFACFWLFAALVVLPGILIYIRRKKAVALESDIYQDRIGNLLRDIRLSHGRPFFFWMTRFVRIICFLSAAVFLNGIDGSCGLQLVALFLLTIFF